ncbi:MAG: TetR/AcrR family transcriptional regulator [Acidimicrobiia bacterium]|nr:TetR/AcrR family transcriptional regulator [Acidimicrobiia bacterium]
MAPQSRASSAETRQRILDATVATLNREGMMGATARAIARAGGFNQALIYYHFDSMEGLFFHVVEDVNRRRLAHFGPRLEQVTSLSELIEVALELQSGAPDPSDNSAVALLVAGWSPDSEMGPKVLDQLRPWDEAVAAAVHRITAGSSLAGMFPVDELAHAISALFLGLQLLSRLDIDNPSTDKVYKALSQSADMATRLLAAFPAPPPELDQP